MGIKKVAGRYHLRWVDERGREHKKVMPAGSTKEDAARFLRDVRVRIDRVKAGLEQRDRNPDKLTVGQVAERWCKGRDDRDRITVRCHVLGSPLADERLERVTPGRIAAHLAALRPSERVRHAKRAELAPQTINQVRKHLIGIFGLAIERGWLLGDNPARRTRQRKVERRPLVTLTAEEIGRLMVTVEQPTAAIFACALLGLRKGEVWNLELSDLDTARWELRVRKSKSGRPRVVPVHPALRGVLADALNRSRSRWLFPGADNRRRSDKTKFGRELARALRAAGITRHLRPHDLRHTAATLMLQAGASLAAVKDVLGHSTIRLTVDTYGHLVTGDLHAAVERMPIEIPLRAVKGRA